MDVEKSFTKTEFCAMCLVTDKEVTINNYKLVHDVFSGLFADSTLNVCRACQHLIQKAVSIIDTVKNNQQILNNVDVVTESTLNTLKAHMKPIVVMTHSKLEHQELSGFDVTQDNDKENCLKDNPDCRMLQTNERTEPIIKQENRELSPAHDLSDDHDYEDSKYPLNTESIDGLVKVEVIVKDEARRKANKKIVPVEYEDSNVPLNTESIDDCVKTEAVVKDEKRKKIGNKNDLPDGFKVEVVYLTPEECKAEMSKQAEDKKFQQARFKCMDCIKGFFFENTYERHMEKHDKSSGKYICDICRQRLMTITKLREHIKRHKHRFRCSICGLTRVSRRTLTEHYHAVHVSDPPTMVCPKCRKVLRTKSSLRHHIASCDKQVKIHVCKICKKTYTTTIGLKMHFLRAHSDPAVKRYACKECGNAFMAPSHLKNHMRKHSNQKNFYCVECNKSFKSQASLQNHFKTTLSHVTNRELPLPCPHCDRRFAVRRDVDRHVNSKHLNVRPYQCEKCDRAYLNNWSLKEHVRSVHEGHKRILNYPCSMCDKVFHHNHVLKAHVMTHLGERPHACPQCEARFTQRSVMRTHVRLVHLKLTRDGRERRPK